MESAHSKRSGFHPVVTDALTRDHAGQLSMIAFNFVSLKSAGQESAFAWENDQEYLDFKVLQKVVCK